MVKYSYTDFLFKNRFFNGKVKALSVLNVDKLKGTCVLSDKTNNRISDVVDMVSNGEITLKNPQILRGSNVFGSVVYGVRYSHSVTFDSGYSREESKFYNYYFETEYDALVDILYYCLFADSLGITEWYSFCKTKGSADSVIRTAFSKNYNCKFNDVTRDKNESPNFKLDLRVKNRSDINAKVCVYFDKTPDIIGKFKFKIVKLSQIDVLKCKMNGGGLKTRLQMENELYEMLENDC